MKGYTRTLIMAVALGGVGFLTAVGLMSVLFATQTDSFAPKSSADAAGWVQAIGSVVAILASYHLGARQAAESQRQEAERHAKQAAKQASIGTLVQTTSDQALSAIQLMLNKHADSDMPAIFVGVHKVIDDTLTTIQKIPMAEVDPPGNMRHVTGIISGLTHVQECMRQFQVALNPPRTSRAYDPGKAQADAETARLLFHHRIAYQAAIMHDHLTALGFPSKYPHPLHESEGFISGQATES